MPDSERGPADGLSNAAPSLFQPLTPESLALAQDAMRSSVVGWATVRVQGERALVLPVPDPGVLFAGLSGALGLAWGVRYAADHAQPPVVRAALRLGNREAGGEEGSSEREGLAQGHTLEDARLLALADALRAFGVDLAQEGQWVEYDPEEGPNTAELQAELEAERAESGRETSGPVGSGNAERPLPEPPRDPQLERARKHIDDLLEQLRDGGQGKQAAQVLARRGYGNTVEESREVYKELKALHGR